MMKSILLAAVLLGQQTTVIPASVADRPVEPAYSQYPPEVTMAIELRGLIDRTEFDQNVLVEHLDFESGEIVDYVTHQISFEPYAGLLRGARGTLLARAGNALDQSVLLATLLKDAGFDARVRRALLPDQQVDLLLQQLGKRDRPIVRPPDPDEAGEIVDRYTGTFAQRVAAEDPSEEVTDKLYEEYARRAESEAEWLLDQLEKAGVELGSADESAALMRDAKDYFWVEYRDGASGEYQQAHPAFYKAGPPVDLEALETFAEEIPPELHHTIEFRFAVEQDVGGKKTERLLGPPWLRPAANLNAVPLKFGVSSAAITANFWDEERGNRTVEVPDSGADIFFLKFNGAPLESAFDVSGNTAPVADALSQFAGVFATITDKVNRAAGALASMDDGDSEGGDKRLARLSAVKLYIVTRSPDGNENEHVRYIYRSDMTGEPEGEGIGKEGYRQLTREFDFMSVSGALQSAFIADELLAAFESKAKTAELILQALVTRVMPDQTLDFDWDAFYPLFDSLGYSRDGVVAYYREPAMVIHHQSLPFEDRVAEGVDLVSLPQRSVRVTGNKPALDPYANLQSGVWASVVESGVLEASGNFPVLDTWRAFQAARDAGVDVILVKPSESKAINDLSLSPVTREVVLRDLAKGHVALMPDTSENPKELEFSWWSVDYTTGTTIGKSLDGQGAVSAEAVVTLMMGVAFYINGWNAGNDCIKKYGGSAPGSGLPESGDDAHIRGYCALCALYAGAASALAVWVNTATEIGGPALKDPSLKQAWKVFVLAFNRPFKSYCGTTVLTK